MAEGTAEKHPSRWKLALLSGWNVAFLAVCGLAAGLLQHPAPLVVGAGAEAAWLAVAMNPTVSRRLFGKKYEAHEERRAESQREALVKTLRPEDVERVARLEERRRDILRLSSENRNFEIAMLHAELGKLDEIVASFVEVAAGCVRWESYLGAVDWDDLESETRKFETDAERAVDEEQRKLAKKNLELILRRRDQLAEMRKKVVSARGQLDLIESTFRLIGNEIMLMRSTQELGGQLDDLLVGVEAVREMTVGDVDAADGERVRAAVRRAAIVEKRST